MSKTADVHRTVTYQCAPYIRWVVELHGIVVINEKSGAVCSVQYPEAAIWDMISRKYSYEQIVPILCAITSSSSHEVEKLLVESLEQWTETGFLIKTENNGEPFHHNSM